MSKVFGVGVNDSTYSTQKFENIEGKYKLVWICKYYRKWKDMLKRCYYQKDFETYRDCYVCKEWLLFSNFKDWCVSFEDKYSVDIVNLHLDKDLLSKGNREYSPDKCTFLHPKVNTFILDSAKIRGELPIGVNLNKNKTKYEAYCRNPFVPKKQHYLGVYPTPEMAHQVWKNKKLAFVHDFINNGYIFCDDVKTALIERYS